MPGGGRIVGERNIRLRCQLAADEAVLLTKHPQGEDRSNRRHADRFVRPGLLAGASTDQTARGYISGASASGAAVLPDDLHADIKAKVDFNAICDQVLPGMQELMRDHAGRHKLSDFVLRYRHTTHILEMGETRFRKDDCKWAEKKGYRNRERMAALIFATAQNGIPVLPNAPSTQIVITEAIRVLHTVEASRDAILTQMQALAKTLPEYSLVREMPCIGDTLAPRLIAEIGDVRRFHSKRALIAYAGIDAPPYQSGKFRANNRHISKRGNRYLRKTGYEVMQSYVMHKPANDPIFTFIEKNAVKGKSVDLLWWQV